MREQLVWGCYMKAEHPGVEPESFELRVQLRNYYATRAHITHLKASKLDVFMVIR